jgi:hypothetical protein
LEGDAYHLAWVRYSLGLSYLREIHPDAERQFLEAECLTRKKSARMFRSRALQGLGNFYRSKGDWRRAEKSYKEAIETAPDQDDLRVAWWSLGRSYRLQGQYPKALEAFHQSLHFYSPDHAPVRVDYAATLLAMGKPAEAGAALDQAKPIQGNQVWLYRILRAELARQAGNPAEALPLLADLPIASLVVREEAPCWPQLFELMAQSGLVAPQPLDYIAQMAVEIQALGALQVRVNGRPVAIASTSKVGELLVLLVEKGPEVSSETLIECLWPGQTLKQKRKTLWQLASELRKALGWPDSIVALGRTYCLDRRTEWRYDVAQARKTGKARAGFMVGVYSAWALEIAEEISFLRAESQEP